MVWRAPRAPADGAVDRAHPTNGAGAAVTGVRGSVRTIDAPTTLYGSGEARDAHPPRRRVTSPGPPPSLESTLARLGRPAQGEA